MTQHRDPERAGHAADRLDLRVGEHLDHRVLPDGDHLGCQDAGGAVERGEGLVEHGHVAADRAGALHEVHLLAAIGDLERRLDAGDASADHECGRSPLGVVGRAAKRERDAVDGAGGDRLGALRGASPLTPCSRNDASRTSSGSRPASDMARREGRLEEAGRVAGDDDPVQLGRRRSRRRAPPGRAAAAGRATAPPPPGAGWRRSDPPTPGWRRLHPPLTLADVDPDPHRPSITVARPGPSPERRRLRPNTRTDTSSDPRRSQVNPSTNRVDTLERQGAEARMGSPNAGDHLASSGSSVRGTAVLPECPSGIS